MKQRHVFVVQSFLSVQREIEKYEIDLKKKKKKKEIPSAFYFPPICSTRKK